jgi:hypothetical protein
MWKIYSVPCDSTLNKSHCIRKDLGELGWGNVDWIGLPQDRNRWRAVANVVVNLPVP